MLTDRSICADRPFNTLPTLLDRQRRVRQLTAILAVMESEWELSMPPMIVSVTGNAAPFQMRPKFNAIFSQALLKATSATGAWVTTGGTDAGVMKLAGEAMKNSHTPVIGISAWGVVAGRGKLARPSQETIRVSTQALRLYVCCIYLVLVVNALFVVAGANRRPDRVTERPCTVGRYQKHRHGRWSDARLLPP